MYFCDGDDPRLTKTILEAYKQLAKVKNFEIVLVYIHDSFSGFQHTSEEAYWKCFREMPWLALPYKDPVCKTLLQVFNHPKFADPDGSEPNPNLVIIGPQGKFVERFGADILLKYGISAYPFTGKKVAKLEAKKMRNSNLFNGGNKNISRTKRWVQSELFLHSCAWFYAYSLLVSRKLNKFCSLTFVFDFTGSIVATYGEENHAYR